MVNFGSPYIEELTEIQEMLLFYFKKKGGKPLVVEPFLSLGVPGHNLEPLSK